ncbi:MAG: T9SS type A sorting domain-containing protein [Ignavibacteriales bacterium]|nr:T9SS type A sorting domain-containing protein [Ignavibacteriales bacterium]
MKLFCCKILVSVLFWLNISEAQQAYYPLEVGNKWEYWWITYNDSGCYFTSKVTNDTLMPNGRNYAVYDNSTLSDSLIHFRQEGDSVYVYIRTLHKEHLLFDFSSKVGDTVNFFYNGIDTTTITLHSYDTISIFGKNLRQWIFYIDANGLPGINDPYYSIADSLGIISPTENYFAYGISARGMIINNQRFGTLMPVVYPLYRGNLWEYSYLGGGYRNTVRAIGDTIMPNGFHYTVLETDFLCSRYHRKEGDSVFIYDAQSEQEYLICDFSLRTPYYNIPLSTLFCGSESRWVSVFYVNYSFDTLFGKRLRKWEILFDGFGFDDQIFYTIIDSIGVSLADNPGWFFGYKLTGARINGTQYGTIVSAEENNQQSPASFTLHQNYPNPFNPQTVIGFSLLAVSNVTLKVHNILGQEVATLLHNSLMDAGKHEVTFDGTHLPSGLYFVKLQAGNFSETKKVALLK